MKLYTDLMHEIDHRLSKLPEVQQWGLTYIKPVIMKKYKRKVVNSHILQSGLYYVL